MSVSDPGPCAAITAGPRSICAALSLAAPLLLAALYGFLVSDSGSRILSGYGSRNVGAGIATVGVILLAGAGIVLFGLVMGVCALRRRERPLWLSVVALALNSAIVLVAIGAVVQRRL